MDKVIAYLSHGAPLSLAGQRGDDSSSLTALTWVFRNIDITVTASSKNICGMQNVSYSTNTSDSEDERRFFSTGESDFRINKGDSSLPFQNNKTWMSNLCQGKGTRENSSQGKARGRGSNARSTEANKVILPPFVRNDELSLTMIKACE